MFDEEEEEEKEQEQEQEQEQEEESHLLGQRRRWAYEAPRTAAKRLKDRRTLLNECKNALNKMMRTWKVAGTESTNSRAQLFESHLQFKRATWLLGYYNMILEDSKLRRIPASYLAARAAGLGKFYGPRCIRIWAGDFENSRHLPSSSRGKHGKAFSLLNDPDICAQIRTYLRGNKWAADPAKLREFTSGSMVADLARRYAQQLSHEEMPNRLAEYLNETLFPRIGVKHQRSISLNTARRWMKREGFRYMAYAKGVYVDGHERADVVEYRQNVFLPCLQSLRPQLIEYAERDVQTEIKKGRGDKPPAILVFHDECTFTANDGPRKSWVLDNSHKLRKKGVGRGIHRSDFICNSVGWLKDGGQSLEYGKNHQGFWTGEMLAQQLKEKAIDAFEAAHPPGTLGVFIFDNSSGHSVYAGDALVASRMNVGPGGKYVPKMRDGWYSVDGIKVSQRMVDQSGTPKGMKVVLQERGLACSGLRGRCNVHADDGVCCMSRMLSEQPDFKEQRPLLQELVENRGHIALFLPKFHCELNIIEYFWGAAKRFTRENCDYTFDGLKKTVPTALGRVSLSTMRRWEQRMWRWIACYAEGKGAQEADIAVKRYTSHRRVSARE